MRSACEIMPDEQERITLEKWSKGRRTPVRTVMRAKTVILAAASLENRDIDVQFGIERDTPGGGSAGFWRAVWRDSSMMPCATVASPCAGKR